MKCIGRLCGPGIGVGVSVTHSQCGSLCAEYTGMASGNIVPCLGIGTGCVGA